MRPIARIACLLPAGSRSMRASPACALHSRPLRVTDHLANQLDTFLHSRGHTLRERAWPRQYSAASPLGQSADRLDRSGQYHAHAGAPAAPRAVVAWAWMVQYPWVPPVAGWARKRRLRGDDPGHREPPWLTGYTLVITPFSGFHAGPARCPHAQMYPACSQRARCQVLAPGNPEGLLHHSR